MNTGRALSDAWRKFRDRLSAEISRGGKAASDISRAASSTPTRAAANTLESKDDKIGKLIAASGEEGNNQLAAAPARKSHYRLGDDGPAPNLSGSSHSDRKANKKIQKQLMAIKSTTVYGFDGRGIDTRTVKEIAKAFEAFHEKYPYATIHSLGIDNPQGRRGFASSRELFIPKGLVVKKDIHGTAIRVNRNYAVDRESLFDRYRRDVQEGQTSPGAERDPVSHALWHEFGHAMNNEGFRAAEDKAQTALVEYYQDIYGKGDAPTETMKGFQEWRAQLSGYSFWREGEFRSGEAVADAFADVELLGSAASEPAHVLHRLAVDEARSRWQARGLI
ncbi:hypothetical protein [Nocardia sp. CC227C]|uniref:hypothetical protein n=1 Tax=Nocardia sp. CC227C TaxID=3044562 RepID=UPI00278C2739|nr:hypothetical protein [Nocardia sp. CC227C]